MRDMRYLSVCSGIEAASVAWQPLGWVPIAFAEIEAFPSAVLSHHYPAVPNLGDMRSLATRILCGEIEAPDILVGGTPCQAFSVAGNRESLSDDRGNLTLRFVELAAAIDAVRSRSGKPNCIVIWENVPGVLSTRDNAFGCFLAGLAGENEPLQPAGSRWSNAGAVLGPKRSVAWRTLDAQYFGLAQRRRRVFVVASARTGFDPCQVLFEWQGLRRDSAPCRSSQEDAAGTLAGGARRRGDTSGPIDVATARSASASASGRLDFESETFVVAGTLRGHPRPGSNSIGATVIHGTQDPCIGKVAFAMGRNTGRENVVCVTGDITHALKAEGADASEDGSGRGNPITAVRRLTPRECERLQGFPDDYTLIPWRGGEAPDGPRYKALGNSMAVPVMRWIGERIARAIAATDVEKEA